MAVRNQASHAPRYRDAYYPPQREAPPPQQERRSQPAGDTLVLSLLFIVVPICFVLSFFSQAFVWIFVIVTVMTLLAIWAIGCFDSQKRSFLSGMLIVFMGIAAVRGLANAPGSAPKDNSFPVYGAQQTDAATLQGQALVASNQQNDGALAGQNPNTANLVDMQNASQPQATQPPQPTQQLLLMTIAPAIVPSTQTAAPAAAEVAQAEGQAQDAALLGQAQPQTLAGAVGTTVSDPGTGQAPIVNTEAAEVLGTFISMWRDKNFDDMVNLTTQTWRTKLKVPPTRQLMYLYQRWQPVSWTISEQSSYTSDVVVFNIAMMMRKGTSQQTEAQWQYTANVYQEGGSWRVDPDMLKGNVVELTNADIQAEEAAQEQAAAKPTVNPSTKIYYNPDGGKYYHADNKCETINEKFYDKMKSTEFSELSSNDALKELRACLKCKAPKK